MVIVIVIIIRITFIRVHKLISEFITDPNIPLPKHHPKLLERSSCPKKLA
jgi:hypothetical protein